MQLQKDDDTVLKRKVRPVAYGWLLFGMRNGGADASTSVY
jgi:hypothetical protein